MVAKTHVGTLLLAGLGLLFGASCSISDEPLFSDAPASYARESLFTKNPVSRSATNSLPASMDTAASPQPAEVNPQLNAARLQPSGASLQPVAVSPQPAEVTPQPVASSPPPSVASPQPAAVSPQPSAASPQPIAAGATTQASTNSASRIPANDMDGLDDKYLLAIGDRISFRIEEDEDDPKPLIVTDSGDLEIPYLGHYPAAGKTCKELAQALRVELEKTYYYRATVIISVDLMTKSRGKVYLVGPVRMPGPQDIPSDEVLTVSKAILRAGGFTDFADQRHVKITRQGGTGENDKETVVVDVGAIFDKGKTEDDVPLKPGDLIYIPERLVHF